MRKLVFIIEELFLLGLLAFVLPQFFLVKADGYGWGVLTIASAPVPTYVINVHDAVTGATITPDSMNVSIFDATNPTTYSQSISCNSNCTSSFSFLPPSISTDEIDHLSNITKAGYNPSDNAGSFKFDPSVPTIPPYYQCNGVGCTKAILDVYLTPIGSPPQIQLIKTANFDPTTFDYYGYIPTITEQINPIAGNSNLTLTTYNINYNSASNTYSANTLSLGGSLPQTINMSPSSNYPNSSFIQLTSVVENPSTGLRSAQANIYFGLDLATPVISCGISPSGNSVSTNLINVSGFDANKAVSGISMWDAQVSTDGGATWSSTGIPNGGNINNFQYAGSYNQTYTFRMREKNKALRLDGTRGIWSNYVNCGTVKVLYNPANPTPSSALYSSTAFVNPSPVRTGQLFTVSTQTTSTVAGQGIIDVVVTDKNGIPTWQADSGIVTFQPGLPITFNPQFDSSYHPSSTDTVQIFVVATDWSSVYYANPNATSFILNDYALQGSIFDDLDPTHDGIYNPSPTGIDQLLNNIRYTINGVGGDLVYTSGATTDTHISPDGTWGFYLLQGSKYTVSIQVPPGYLASTPTIKSFTMDDTNNYQSYNFGLYKNPLGGTALPPSCSDIVATPNILIAGGFPNTSLLTISCTPDAFQWDWTITSPNPAIGTLLYTTTTTPTNSYTAPVSIPTPTQTVVITVTVSGPGGSKTYSTVPAITIKSGLKPWIQTINGDVHGNEGIHTPGGP